jgi:hypothetical protein
MKLRDVPALFSIVAIVLFFTLGRDLYDAAYEFSPLLVAFLKFALLATFGEMCVSRILGGAYLPRGFGLLPKALVWGILGLAVYAAFNIFEGGVTAFFFAGGAPASLLGSVLRALLISVFMNAFFAPVLMVTHHASDLHIAANGGRFPIRGLNVGSLLGSIDWQRFFGFVIARTIPLFWLPAHTVTFLLPPRYRLLYASGLSVVLGLFMALARRGSSDLEGRVAASEAAEQAVGVAG